MRAKKLLKKKAVPVAAAAPADAAAIAAPAAAQQSTPPSRLSRCGSCVRGMSTSALSVLLLLLALLWMFVQIACTYHAAKTSQVSSLTSARAAAADAAAAAADAVLQGQVADAAPGQLFDIGAGVQMHMLCAGNVTAAAPATVVLESMEAVGQALQWGAVMELLKVTRMSSVACHNAATVTAAVSSLPRTTFA